MIINVSWSDTLNVGDRFTQNLVDGNWSDTLFIAEQFDTNIQQATIRDTLHIDDTFGVGFVVKNLSFSDNLNIQDSFHRAHESLVEEFLYITDLFTQGPTANLTDTLTLTEGFTADVSKSINDVLIITDEYGYNLNRILSWTDDLLIKDKFDKSFIDTRINNPIFNLPSAPTVPPLPTPVPLGSPSSYNPTPQQVTIAGIILPPPEFGDTDMQSAKRVAVSAQDSTALQVFRENYWPTTRQFSMTFAYLKEDQKETLRQLSLNLVGQAFTYIDHFSRSWLLFLMEPIEIRQEVRKGYSVTLKVQKLED